MSETSMSETSLNQSIHYMYQRVSVVIPAMNEAENLPHVLPRIPPWVSEVVLVDGRSKDGTVEVAQQLLPDIRIITQQGRGKGDALRAGFEAVTGDLIVMLDADGSTDPAEIPLFVNVLFAGADFAKGSRFLHGGGTADMPFHRKLGNWGFVLGVRAKFGGQYSDLCYGYNAFWRHVLPQLGLDGDGFEIETMINLRALRAGLKIVEVPSFEAKRIYGSSNLRTIPDGWRVVKTILKEPVRSQKGGSKEALPSTPIRAVAGSLSQVPDGETRGVVVHCIDRRRPNRVLLHNHQALQVYPNRRRTDGMSPLTAPFNGLHLPQGHLSHVHVHDGYAPGDQGTGSYAVAETSQKREEVIYLSPISSSAK